MESSPLVVRGEDSVARIGDANSRVVSPLAMEECPLFVRPPGGEVLGSVNQ